METLSVTMTTRNTDTSTDRRSVLSRPAVEVALADPSVLINRMVQFEGNLQFAINLLRFLDLVEEFRREAQLLIVSHQKRTMEVADTLYGVTMQPGGSSRCVSERVSAGA